MPVLEKAMAPHSSVLAWRIPGTGEPGGLPSMGSHRVGHTEVTYLTLPNVPVYKNLGKFTNSSLKSTDITQ